MFLILHNIKVDIKIPDLKISETKHIKFVTDYIIPY